MNPKIDEDTSLVIYTAVGAIAGPAHASQYEMEYRTADAGAHPSVTGEGMEETALAAAGGKDKHIRYTHSLYLPLQGYIDCAYDLIKARTWGTPRDVKQADKALDVAHKRLQESIDGKKKEEVHADLGKMIKTIADLVRYDGPLTYVTAEEFLSTRLEREK